MDTAILTVHIIVCIILVILVLLQAGKEGMGVIMGGGGSSTFGPSGAGNLLTKLTAGLAALFVITSLAYNLAISSSDDEESSILDVQFEEVAPNTSTNAPISDPIKNDAITITPIEPTVDHTNSTK